jgi:predicted MFS family arabinose efflux permease
MGKNIWLVLFLTVLLIFLNADQMVMAPNIGMIESEFGVTDTEIGFIASTFTILGALISLIWGYLTDKYNRKYLLILSILVGEIPCLMSAFSGSYTELFVWRALTGIGVGASFPIAFSYIGDMYEGKKRGNMVAILSASVTIGSIVGMVVGGLFGETAGWRLPFILVSAPNIALGFVALFILKEPKRGAFEEGLGEKVRQGFIYTKRISFKDYLKLFKIKTNLLLFLQGILGTVPWGAIPYFLVEFFKRERGLDAGQATLVFVFFGLGSVVGVLAGGWLGQRLYARKKGYLPIFCSLTTLLGVFLTLWVFDFGGYAAPNGVLILTLLGFVAAFFDSTTGPGVKMMLLNVNEPYDRGRIFSVFNLTDSLGTGIGKLFGGVLSGALGTLGAALKISAFFWLGCSVFLFVLVYFFSSDVNRLDEKMKRE